MGAVNTIVENRKDGKYKSIFDLTKRIDLRSANKKAIENLILAGGFDSFANTTRAQYFHTDGEGITFYEKALRFAEKSRALGIGVVGWHTLLQQRRVSFDSFDA